MEGSKKTRKREQTQERIIEAFLDLYAQKPFEQITVISLTQSMGINRGTFYLHYLDLDELVISLEDKHLNAIRKLCNEYRFYHLSNSRSEIVKFFTPILEYLGQNRSTIAVLMSPHSRPRFTEELKMIMRNNVKYKSETIMHREKWDEFKQYIVEIVLEGNMGIITDWVFEKNTMSAEEVADQFADILLNLPYANLRQE